ncbi:MAG: insulinase family protein [Pseudomonadota bacterium]
MPNRDTVIHAVRRRVVSSKTTRDAARSRGSQIGAVMLFAVMSALLIACSSSVPTDSELTVTQSPNDDFAYRYLVLDNGLRTLLISNPDSPKAAAALDVEIGSGDNPRSRPGLAHFLEHMLFLGTEKYPDPAAYEQYITEHGGSRNAYTSFEHTNYFFDIDPDFLDEGLDRFAQFFIAPTLDSKYVERERNAVQAEYQMGIKSDGRRGLDVLQESMNSAHPFSQFSVGSLETLADRPDATVRDDLLAFYNQYYSANLMRLAVLGTESLDELEAKVRTIFSAVPNRSAKQPVIDQPMFIDAQLPMLLKIRPEGTRRQLEINFEIPEFRDQYDAKPMAYVSNLVGHEGEGSLLSALKAAGLADGLSSGTGLEWRGGALFSITVSLTEQGVGRYEEVLQHVFAYLEMLRSQNPERRIFDEQAALAQLAFRFREPTAPIRYVSSVASSMHYFSPQDTLSGGYTLSRFAPDEIKRSLENMRPETAQVVLTAPEVETDQVSKYYEVPYALAGPEVVLLSRWTSDDVAAMSLPEPNPFIAESVELLPIAEGKSEVPTTVLDNPRKRIWYKQAADFRVPKGFMYVSFRSPMVGQTPEQKAAALLYTRVVKDALNEYTYPAYLAGLGFDFYRHAQGISMRLSGYNDKQLFMLDKLLSDIADQEFDPERVERIRREMILSYENTVARRPSSQLVDDVRQALSSGEFDEQSMIDALTSMSVDSLQEYREQFWASARAEALVYGNHSEASARTLGDALDLVLGAGPGQVAQAPTVTNLEVASPLQLESNIAHNDSVVIWYLQGAGRELDQRAQVSLTAQIVQSGFFQQLRTEQQLGYIVSSFPWSRYDLPGLAFVVQSPNHSASHVANAMDTFLVDTLEQISEEQFLRNKRALIKDLLKPDENLSERAQFYWQAIAFRKWDFDEPQRLAEAVEGIDYASWQESYRSLFVDDRRSLIAFSPGAQGEGPDSSDGRRFSEPAELRSASDLLAVDLAPL